ncbi:MAG: hypothetical protein KUG77_04135 [Nannocystaceae bacterium]|nr:hypothetical protein [Nannocystaceae bacterium]
MENMGERLMLDFRDQLPTSGASAVRLRRRRTCLLMSLLVAGCGSPIATTANEGSSGAKSSTGSGPPGRTSTGSSTTDVDSTTWAGDTTNSAETLSTESGNDNPTDTPACSFLCDEPGTSGVFQCSTWEQNCPPGAKCALWANDGGGGWNANRCVPISLEPREAGETCTVEDTPTSGLDDCDVGLLCWHIDSDTLQGICEPMCHGSEFDPVCDDPARSCYIAGDGVIHYCVLRCDPLEPDACPPGLGCYEDSGGTMCMPTRTDAGGLFETCDFITDCQPGLSCMTPSVAPDICANASGCCIPYCDLTAPSCPEGTLCIPTSGSLPEQPGFKHVGFCGSP